MNHVDEVIYDACIVGMGIGGLATALALQKEGLSIYVTEKDNVLSDRKQGYGLTLTNSTSGPLAKLGLLDACIQSNCPSHSHFTFDGEGNILGYYGRSVTKLLNEKRGRTESEIVQENCEDREFGGSRGNLRVPRQELRQLMLQRLKQESLHWGHRFLRFEETSTEYVTTHFEVSSDVNTTNSSLSQIIVKSRILIGADGIRSCIRQQRDDSLRLKDTSPLRYVGASVILGISEIDHPLLHNRGYYVLDGKQRLFTMPFLTPTGENSSSSASVDTSEELHRKRQVLWQLSFSDASEQDGRLLRSSGHDHIMQQALHRTKHWFPAVTELITATLPGEIWATPLYDRNAMMVLRSNEQIQHGVSRVTVLGDACHPMSMFKGQGANQALEDSVLIASKLRQRLEDMKRRAQKRKRDEIDSKNDADNSDGNSINNNIHEEQSISLKDFSQEAMCNLLRTFEREMIARADKKVQASREAAQLYHCAAILEENVGIHGVDNVEDLPAVVKMLKDEHIDASLGEELENRMSRIISDFVLSRTS